jgi:hypothetical protein
MLDVNPFLIKMLGYSHKDFMGKKLWEIGPFSDIAASKLRDRGYIDFRKVGTSRH